MSSVCQRGQSETRAIRFPSGATSTEAGGLAGNCSCDNDKGIGSGSSPRNTTELHFEKEPKPIVRCMQRFDSGDC